MSGLPANARDGEVHDITMWFVSRGRVCVATVPFRVTDASDREAIHVASANREPLDLAPPGDPPLVLPVGMPGRIRRSLLSAGAPAPAP